MTPLLTVRDVAAHLGVSESMVRKLARTGRLAGHRMGDLWRFDVQAVQAYLEHTRISPALPAETETATLRLVLDDAPSPRGYEPADFDAALARQAASESRGSRAKKEAHSGA